MKKILLYYVYLLAGAIVFLVLLFPNIVFKDTDTEIGPLQRNLLLAFAVSYLLGMVLISRQFLTHLFKQLSISSNLIVDVKRVIRVHFERFWVLWISTAFIIFPLAPLFDINVGFSIDWYNHLWLVGYYGEYFSAHWVMPAALNTNQTILIAYPTFYGHLLYATLGTLSAYVGANLAVRIGVLVLWIMKFVLAYLATMEFSKDKALSIAVGIMICWEIYPLTNLYNRGALTEMFATGLLLVSFYAGLLAFYKRDNHQKMTCFFLAGFAASLSGMAHPITAFFGFMFLVIIFLVFVFWGVLLGDGSIGKMVAVIAIVVLISYVLGVLSPWAYATNVFKDRLAITSFLNDGPIIFPDSIDHILVRFSPFPFDKRSLYDGTHPMGGTPYLDAQVNIPLLVLAVVLVMNRRSANLSSAAQVNKRIGASVFWVSIVLFVVSTSLSMSPLLYRYIPIFRSVQIAYRMVTYQNLSIAAVVISLLLLQRHSNLPRNFKLITLAVCLTLAGNGLLLKFWHIHAIANTVPAERQYNATSQNRNNFLDVPNTFYGLDAYTLSRNPLNEPSNVLPAISVNLRLKEDSFGRFEGQSLFASEEMWVQTNAAFSPWNEILIDGSPAQVIDDINNDQKMDVLVTPGKHYISARFAPDPTFQSLRRISNLSFTAWTFTTIAWLLFFSLRKFLRIAPKRIT